MAKAIAEPTIDVRVRFEINYDEACALDALAGYGEDTFIKAFYEQLGEAYMRSHEQGLREFLRTIRSVVAPAMHKVEEAKKVLKYGANPDAPK